MVKNNLTKKVLKLGLISGLFAVLAGCNSYQNRPSNNFNSNGNYNLNSNDNQDYIDRDRKECEAMNGVWARWGLDLEESCNIKTGDYGKECDDGSQCEGECITPCSNLECTDEIGICSKYRRFVGTTRSWINGEQRELIAFD